MKISFALESIIIQNENFKTENRKFWQKVLNLEKIKKGTFFVLTELKKHNHQVGIHTHNRNKLYIKFLFLSYGIFIDFVVHKKSIETTFPIDICVGSEMLTHKDPKKYFKIINMNSDDDFENILTKINV